MSIETYLELEKVAVAHDSAGEERKAELTREVMDVVWKRLTKEEVAQLNARGYLGPL